jgi:ferredoxin
MQHSLRTQGLECHVLDIERPSDCAGLSATHIFMFPVYAGSVPEIMLRHMSKMHLANGADAAVIATFGSRSPGKDGQEGRALEQASIVLASRGYDVFYTNVAAYPVNFTAVINPPDGETTKRIITRAACQMRDMAEEISSLKRYRRRPSIFIYFISTVAGSLFLLFGRRLLGKCYIADAKCTGCAVCARACPDGVIVMQSGRPAWDISCQACQRCINICPQQAIQLSLVRAAVIILGMFVPWHMLLGLYGIGFWRALLINVPLYFIIMLFVDYALRYAENFAPLRRLLSISLTRTYRRYMEEGFRRK